VYAQPALIPASPWLDSQPPTRPRAIAEESASGESLKLSWSGVAGEGATLWVVQSRLAGKWRLEIFAGQYNSCIMKGAPDVLAVSAVDRTGNLSAPVILERKK
jgi:hypothetical protein